MQTIIMSDVESIGSHTIGTSRVSNLDSTPNARETDTATRNPLSNPNAERLDDNNISSPLAKINTNTNNNTTTANSNSNNNNNNNKSSSNYNLRRNSGNNKLVASERQRRMTGQHDKIGAPKFTLETAASGSHSRRNSEDRVKINADELASTTTTTTNITATTLSDCDMPARESDKMQVGPSDRSVGERDSNFGSANQTTATTTTGKTMRLLDKQEQLRHHSYRDFSAAHRVASNGGCGGFGDDTPTRRRPAPSSTLIFSMALVGLALVVLLGHFGQPVEGVDCFKCSSRNGSNPACEDPFHNLNTTRVNHPVLPDPQPSVIYHTPCYAGKKGREGLFPASACIKLTGTFDTTGETLVVRHCALDSGTLTQDTELARMSHCGKFQFEGDLLKGCVLACPEDACNSAPNSPFAMILARGSNPLTGSPIVLAITLLIPMLTLRFTGQFRGSTLEQH